MNICAWPLSWRRRYPDIHSGPCIVRRITGEVLAKGYNRSSRNPTVHGEIDVINRCAAKHAPVDWTALDLYTTAEPCPMCQSAIEWAALPPCTLARRFRFSNNSGGGKSIFGPRRWRDELHFGTRKSLVGFWNKSVMRYLRRHSGVRLKNKFFDSTSPSPLLTKEGKK